MWVCLYSGYTPSIKCQISFLARVDAVPWDVSEAPAIAFFKLKPQSGSRTAKCYSGEAAWCWHAWQAMWVHNIHLTPEFCCPIWLELAVRETWHWHTVLLGGTSWSSQTGQTLFSLGIPCKRTLQDGESWIMMTSPSVPVWSKMSVVDVVALKSSLYRLVAKSAVHVETQERTWDISRC